MGHLGKNEIHADVFRLLVVAGCCWLAGWLLLTGWGLVCGGAQFGLHANPPHAIVQSAPSLCRCPISLSPPPHAAVQSVPHPLTMPLSNQSLTPFPCRCPSVACRCPMTVTLRNYYFEVHLLAIFETWSSWKIEFVIFWGHSGTYGALCTPPARQAKNAKTMACQLKKESRSMSYKCIRFIMRAYRLF